MRGGKACMLFVDPWAVCCTFYWGDSYRNHLNKKCYQQPNGWTSCHVFSIYYELSMWIDLYKYPRYVNTKLYTSVKHTRYPWKVISCSLQQMSINLCMSFYWSGSAYTNVYKSLAWAHACCMSEMSFCISDGLKH